MTTYTTEIAATLATLAPISSSRGICAAEITYSPLDAEAFWAIEEAADLILDQLGLTPGEHQVTRGTVVADAAGIRSERLRIS